MGHTDAIADDIALRLLESEPVYAQGGPELHAELRASCREHTRRGVRTMAGLAEPDDAAVHVWRETGRTRARQGVPMDAVLRAYSTGSRALWEGLLDRAHRGDLEVDERVLLLAGQTVWRALETQTATMAQAYRREEARLHRRDLQRQQNLLDGLVEGRGADPLFAADAREGLGIGDEDLLVCVVAPIEDPLDEPLKAPHDRLDRSGIVSHWHVRSGASFGIVAVSGRSLDDVVQLLQPCVAGRVGVADVSEGLAGVAMAYRLASRAAETLPAGTRRVVTLAQRLPEVLVAGSPEVVPALLASTLDPVLALPTQQADVLLDTLAALLRADGSPTHAAEVLYCHRNTVIYRMRQLESLTGRKLHDARDKLLLTLALLATGRSPDSP
ncbi:MAG: PucR family transcriptional regulator [Propionibacteriales bacterium]|nr:PucR family transcriptional regulator [Propionibacteriales bacterium]